MTLDSIVLPNMPANITPRGRQRFIAQSPFATDEHLKVVAMLKAEEGADPDAQALAFTRLEARQKSYISIPS